MMLRVKKNKFILGGILAFILLVLIIVLVSYFKWFYIFSIMNLCQGDLSIATNLNDNSKLLLK